MEEVLRRALREACAVTGEMASSLVRRKVSPGAMKRWQKGLETANKILRRAASDAGSEENVGREQK